jgi:4-hydroxybenzoate polyprenyltransferase
MQLVRAMRPHQWVKNLLLFVPLVTAHRITDAQAWAHALQAFVAMCLAAAAIYIANDLLDLDADRAHRSKSQRPFAGGRLPLWAGIATIPILLAAAVAVASTLPVAFASWLGTYAGLGFLYSAWLKRLAVVDVLLLASLYTLRLISGAAAIGVPVIAYPTSRSSRCSAWPGATCRCWSWRSTSTVARSPCSIRVRAGSGDFRCCFCTG